MLGFTSLASVVAVIRVIWLYILISAVALSWYSFTYLHVIIQLFSVYSYHVISWLSVYTCYNYHIVSYLFSVISAYCLFARALPLYTHSLSRFDDPEFERPAIGHFLILFRCSMGPYASWGAGVTFYSIMIFLSSFHFCSCTFLDTCISDQSLFYFFIHVLSVWTFICSIAVIVDSF